MHTLRVHVGMWIGKKHAISDLEAPSTISSDQLKIYDFYKLNKKLKRQMKSKYAAWKEIRRQYFISSFYP